MRILDRYIFKQFMKIFAVCAVGAPFLFMVVDLVENLDRFLAQGLDGGQIASHYLYQFPFQMLLAFPLATLLSAVFTVSNMTRHFETTAAKAGGISFHRLTLPILVGGVLLSVAAAGLTELVPVTNRKSEQAFGDQETRSQTIRTSFVYRGNEGRVYKARRLDARQGRMLEVQVEREGTGFGYPTYNIHAPVARWDPAAALWVLEEGRIRFFPNEETTLTFRFRELWQRHFREKPERLLADPKEPDDMGYFELGRYIEAIQRSGGKATKLEVARYMKISFPVACFVIVLFGTPLGHTTRRGGTTFAIGVALMVTILFLIMVRIAQAMGAGGTVSPLLAAWLPNLVFLGAGLVLTAKVRT
ncbi:MAG: LptF/LptG family permease [Gemmatimonadota bacterium]